METYKIPIKSSFLVLNTQAEPKSLNSLEDEEELSKDSNIYSQKGENIQLMVELTPQTSSKNSLTYTQITPNDSHKPITVSADDHKVNLNPILHPRSNENGHDDEVIPLPEILEYAEKVTSPAQGLDKYKVGDLTSKKSFSLKSKCADMKSKIKGSTVKLFCGAFILILALTNLAIIIYLAVYYFRNKVAPFTAVNGALSYVASSLYADPILDIQPGPSCPAGYHSLLLGNWPGTTDGCQCATYLRSGECFKSGRGANETSCNDIDSIAPIRLYEWGTSEWCVMKAKFGSQYQRAAKCAQGFKKCSSGICVLDTLDCPVTKVEMTGGIISMEKVAGNPPIIGFVITPNDIPCFSDNLYASGPAGAYALIDENENGCGKYGPDDQYTFALGQQNQKDIFRQNDFPREVYKLPDYAHFYKRTDSVLSYRTRMSVAEKDICLNIDAEILKSPPNVLKYLKRFLEGTLIAALIVHGYLIFFVGMWIILSLCEKTPVYDILSGKEDEPSKYWIFFYFIGAIVGLIDFTVMFAATVHFRAKLLAVSDYLIELVEARCFLQGSQAYAASNDYQLVVDDVAGKYLRCSFSLFLVGAFAFFSCTYLLYKAFKR